MQQRACSFVMPFVGPLHSGSESGIWCMQTHVCACMCYTQYEIKGGWKEGEISMFCC